MSEARRTQWMKRGLWLLGLWLAGVAVVGALAALLKALMRAAGLTG